MINYTERLDKALRQAAWAHEQQGQHRKGTDIPYTIHPVGVMMIASNVTNDEDTLIACLLHDILEDVESTIYSEDSMRQEFGPRVVDIVRGVTKNDDITGWKERSKAYLTHLEKQASDESIIVSIADKTHNLLSILNDYRDIGDELWQRFTTKNSEDQLWWYTSILTIGNTRKAPQVLLDTLALQLQELQTLMEQKMTKPSDHTETDEERKKREADEELITVILPTINQ